MKKDITKDLLELAKCLDKLDTIANVRVSILFTNKSSNKPQKQSDNKK